MKKYVLLLVVLILGFTVSAQKRTLEINKKYAKAKIVQMGRGTFSAKNVTLLNDTVLQYNSGGGDGSLNMQQISTSTVRYVKVKKGTYAVIGVLAGAGIGLLSSVYAVLTVENDPTYGDTTDFPSGAFIAGFTAGCALIGSIVGVSIPKWRTYFIPNQKTSFSINFSPSISPAYCGLGIKMKF
jgi:hypothetical protein